MQMVVFFIVYIHFCGVVASFLKELTCKIANYYSFLAMHHNNRITVTKCVQNTMIKVNIKPLSVNESWQGKRFRTDRYGAYEKELILKLPKLTIPKGKLTLKVIQYLSNKNNDVDNQLKPFIDILQKKYNFNDNRIYKIIVEKVIVSKGSESISFEITEYEN